MFPLKNLARKGLMRISHQGSLPLEKDIFITIKPQGNLVLSFREHKQCKKALNNINFPCGSEGEFRT